MDTRCSPAAPAEVTVSAPGKVLVAGGYLVTQRPHPGLVFSVSARFHTTVRQRRGAADEPAAAAEAAEGALVGWEVLVESPQYHASYQFRVALRHTPSAEGDASSGTPYIALHNLYNIFSI